MLIEAMGQIVYPQNVRYWGKQINTKEFRQRLLNSTLLKGPMISGLQVYYIAYPKDEYELFCFDHNDLQSNIVYYCRIRTSTTRNQLFVPSVGFSTSAVWRDPTLRQKGFALSVYERFICKKLIDKCIISDLQQTEYGIDAFVRLAAILTRNNWNLYAGFSAPSDAPCLVKLSVPQFLDCLDYLFGTGSAYSYRCGVLLKPTVNPIGILNKPQNTLVLTYDEAVDLGVFVNPIPLSQLEENLLDSELNRPQKH